MGFAQAILAGYDSVRERAPIEKENTILAAEVGAARFALTRAQRHTFPKDKDFKGELGDPSECIRSAIMFSALARKDRSALEPTAQDTEMQI